MTSPAATTHSDANLRQRRWAYLPHAPQKTMLPATYKRCPRCESGSTGRREAALVALPNVPVIPAAFTALATEDGLQVWKSMRSLAAAEVHRRRQ